MKNSKNTTAKKQSNYTDSKDGKELKKFFVDSLKDIYWAEKHLLKALPKMAKESTSEELKNAFETHKEQTQTHIDRLEQVFEIAGLKATAKKCDAMAGLLEEADGIIEETEKGTMVRDAAIICAAQKVEHYEMATYGSLRTLAKVLGMNNASEILQTTLDEEQQTDLDLTDIAESFVNEEALAE